MLRVGLSPLLLGDWLRLTLWNGLRAVLWNLKRYLILKKQAALSFQENKEGKDVLYWGKGELIDRFQ